MSRVSLFLAPWVLLFGEARAIGPIETKRLHRSKLRKSCSFQIKKINK
jgi:hypothetical protein